MNIGPMLNLYPDSLGGTLDDVVDFLKTEEAEGAFSSCYILSQCSGALADIVSCKFCGLEDDSLCGVADLGVQTTHDTG